MQGNQVCGPQRSDPWATEQEVAESVRKEPAQEEGRGVRRMTEDAEVV